LAITNRSPDEPNLTFTPPFAIEIKHAPRRNHLTIAASL
jgi:hypothetical protein